MEDNELSNLRLKIDRIDEELFKLFSERQNVAKRIRLCKKKYDLPIIDNERQRSAIGKRLVLANEIGLVEKDACDLYDFLCNKAVEAQESI